MPETITVTLNAELSSGVTAGARMTLGITAYDVIEETILAGAEDTQIQVQPGAADQLKFLFINASDVGGDLTYKVNSDAGDAIPLDAPHMFVGGGAMGFLGSAAPESLFFSNATAADATVSILVGRNAIVP